MVEITKEWDTARTKHSDALDDILEALGSQPVPPDFHQTSADSSLFGSQHLSAEEHKENPSINNVNRNSNENRSTPTTPLRSDGRLSLSPVSPSATLRRNSHGRKECEHEHGRGKTVQSPASKDKVNRDRKKWKTLRDFVDDQAIEDVLDTIDQDRVALDVRVPFQIPLRQISLMIHSKYSVKRMNTRNDSLTASIPSKPRFLYRIPGTSLQSRRSKPRLQDKKSMLHLWLACL